MIKIASILFALMIAISFGGVTFASSPAVLNDNPFLQDTLPLGSDEDKDEGKGEEGKMEEDKGDDKGDDKGEK